MDVTLEDYGEFFEPIKGFKHDNLEQLISDQLFWVPTQHLEPVPRVFEYERKDSRDHSSVKFSVNPMTANHFKYKEKLPVAAFPAQPTEEYILSRSKKRICILLSQNSSLVVPSDAKASLRGKKHIVNNTGIFLPLFSSISKEHPNGGIPQELVSRIKRLRYPQFFYIKRSNATDSVIPNLLINESICRLDRGFPALIHHTNVTPLDMKLQSEILDLLLAWLGKFQNISISEKLEESLSNILEMINADENS